MSGFENFVNPDPRQSDIRNGLDQLLINVANERLQFFFNEHIFSQDQEDLKQGGIDWTKIHYDNNGPILSLFEVHTCIRVADPGFEDTGGPLF